jgi:predicted amidohydrolase
MSNSFAHWVRCLVVMLPTWSAAAGSVAEAEEARTVRIALASIRRGDDLAAGVAKIERVLAECSAKQVAIVCFPETFLPGLRGGDEPVPAVDQPAMEKAIETLGRRCADQGVAAIVGVEWKTERGLENRAVVISREGKVVGHQTKNQITPGGEAENYVPEGTRQMFELDGVKFGIVICHEGWRYPETVRWATTRGAQIIFQPQVTGSDQPGPYKPRDWGEAFYEKAMQCRAQENTVYFASVNRCLRRQNSATSLIDPKGRLIDHVPCGEERVLIADLDLTQATGFYARRYQPELYQEAAAVATEK